MASGLFVKLDAEYPTDDEFIEAGPMAELLFIRSLCFCKRKRLDGTITRLQLAAVAANLPGPMKLAARLVEVGLWTLADDGWSIPSWFKHNKSAADIAADKEARRLASVEANHAQHHVGPGKKKSPKCELCRTDGPPNSAPISEPDRTRNRLQEVEVEVEPQGEVEVEADLESSSVSPRAQRERTTTDDNTPMAALRILAGEWAQQHAKPAKRQAYIGSVIANAEDHLPTLRTMHVQHPGAEPAALARAYDAGGWPQAISPTMVGHPSSCDCDGTGWVETIGGGHVERCTRTEWPDATIHQLRATS